MSGKHRHAKFVPTQLAGGAISTSSSCRIYAAASYHMRLQYYFNTRSEESGTTKHVSGRSPKWNIILFLKHECQLQPQYRSSFMLVSNQICRPFGRDVLRCLACTTFMLGAVPYVETSVSELSRASAISDFPSELDYELDARAAYRLQARPPVNNILQICIIN